MQSHGCACSASHAAKMAQARMNSRMIHYSKDDGVGMFASRITQLTRRAYGFALAPSCLHASGNAGKQQTMQVSNITSNAPFVVLHKAGSTFPYRITGVIRLERLLNVTDASLVVARLDSREFVGHQSDDALRIIFSCSRGNYYSTVQKMQTVSTNSTRPSVSQSAIKRRRLGTNFLTFHHHLKQRDAPIAVAHHEGARRTRPCLVPSRREGG